MDDSGKGDHETRVRDAFDSLHRTNGQREAADRRDRDTHRRELTAVQEKHGWLYRELAEHPELSNILNELALWGF